MSWIGQNMTSNFFTNEFTSRKKKFAVGANYEVAVPEKYKKTHGAFNSAIVEVVSKKSFLSRHPIKNVEANKIVCKILEAPEANKHIKIIGLEYPIRRDWLKLSKHRCSCDMRDVLMVTGCTCGGC